MKKIIPRVGLIILIPFLPLAFLIDVLVGDSVTGFKTPIKEKLSGHVKQFVILWGGKQ